MKGWLAIAACLSVGYAAESVELAGRAMGTTWVVKIAGAIEEQERDGVRQRVAARLEELEAMFSTYRANSTVSRFNAGRETEWVAVPGEVALVARECRAVSELTGGGFDVTVGPLVRLWGFGPAGSAEGLPEMAEIEARRRWVGFAGLDVRQAPPALRKRAGEVEVDFSSMAKGFAADEVSRVLVALGWRDHLVLVAGDLKSSGRGAGADGWRVGVERPSALEGVAATVMLRDGVALSTSGNYRNVIVREGRPLGHIIDPRTGRPVESDLVAASVVHASSAWASALATGFFVLGAEEGMRVAKQHAMAVLFQVREAGAVVSRPTAAWEKIVDQNVPLRPKVQRAP